MGILSSLAGGRGSLGPAFRWTAADPRFAQLDPFDSYVSGRGGACHGMAAAAAEFRERGLLALPAGRAFQVLSTA